MTELDIAEVARESGLPASTLRYYEEKGLIESIGRRGLRRLFDAQIRERLALISLAQAAGFTLDEIAGMFGSDGRPRLDKDVLAAKADELDATIRRLVAMRDGLRHAAACPAPSHMECPTFQRLLRAAASGVLGRHEKRSLTPMPKVEMDQKSRRQEDRMQPDGRLSDEERGLLLELLESTRDNVLKRAAGLTDEAWSYRPAPNRWTVAEIVEHLMLFEEGVFKLKKIGDAMASGADPHWASATAGREEVLLREASNRRQRIQAPEPFRPSGKLHRREVVERYTKARAKTIEFIRGTGLPIKAYTAESVGYGTMNVYQWVLYMALHNERHNQQIAEVTAATRFPL